MVLYLLFFSIYYFRLEGTSAVALAYNGKLVSIMRRPEFYPHRKEERCARTFGTTDDNHPMIKVCVDYLLIWPWNAVNA